MAAVYVFPMQAQAISAQKAILLDGTTGRILYEKDATSRSLIASTTKIMTALIVCEQCNVLDRMCIPKEAVGIEGSSMYLQEGEVLSIQELLYGMMLHSGNDAATALAIYCGGTEEGFVQLMNDKARLLGLDGTHFANPHGLDAPDHYSNAKDLGNLAAYALQNPIFSMTVGSKSVRIGQRYLTNHNRLLWRVDGANGVKTGYTKAAGRILVSGAKRQNRQLVCVTINAPDDWNDHTTLLEQGFDKYRIRTLVREGQILGSVEVIGGDTSCVALLAAEEFSFPIADDEQVSVVLSGLEFAYAPVVKGQTAMKAHILIDGEVIGSVELIYGDTVECQKEQKRNIWQRLLGK